MKLTEYDRDFIARSIRDGYTSGRLDVCGNWIMWELKLEKMEDNEEETN